MKITDERFFKLNLKLFIQCSKKLIFELKLLFCLRFKLQNRSLVIFITLTYAAENLAPMQRSVCPLIGTNFVQIDKFQILFTVFFDKFFTALNLKISSLNLVNK